MVAKKDESIVDKKFQLTLRDFIWLCSLLLSVTYFYFDDQKDDKEDIQIDTALYEYKLDQLQINQANTNKKLDNVIDILLQDKVTAKNN